ncbi:MAG: cytochrome b N-terminal domain-containing protein [Acidobacteriaceae bacterium]|nr:cytochrome b N-terminal domain-containing protein [Acidobacteriaceae bacterium]
MKSLRNITTWLEDRTGVRSATIQFLNEYIPGSSGWRQVFGSVALFLLLVQGFTGILLALNYAPIPGDAYNSVRYILIEMTGGKLVRGLHHWGSSLLIIVIFLHITQVFLYGAYKKPRELTWISGVGLLLLALTFGLTGYLLPWDNRAYWGTIVTTQIASHAPLVGPYVLDLMGAKSGVGVLTLTRFYGLHVMVLPAAIMLLVLFHVYLVRRHGVAPTPRDHSLSKKQFYPEQVFKDTVAIFIAFTILFALAVLVHVPLSQIADQADSTYIPRPEWYFLFLFQLLKFFQGPLEVVGSVILPSCAIIALILVPFVDRGKIVYVAKRGMAFVFVGLAFGAWTALTLAAMATTPTPLVSIDYSRSTDWIRASPAELLARSGSDTQNVPEFAMRGASIYQQHHCSACHLVNGTGERIGPPLNGLSKRRSRSWIEAHFSDPAKLSPGSIMPRFKLSRQQTADLTSYLLSLEGE